MLPSLTPVLFFFPAYLLPRQLHSSPTRRSSDLPKSFDPHLTLAVLQRLERVACGLSKTGLSLKIGLPVPKLCEQMPNPFKICLRSEEHTSELQSRFDLVCRLLLEKKKRRELVRR